MSGDENIIVSVDQAEIDAAIEKLDEALAKTSQLTGQTPQEEQSHESGSRPLSRQVQAIYDKEQFHTLPNSEMQKAPVQVDVSDSEAKIADLEAKLAEAKANVDDVVSGGETKIAGLEAELEAARNQQNIDFTTLPNSEMDELNAKAVETQANVDDVVADSKEKLDFVKQESDAIKDAIADAIADTDQTLSDQQVKVASARLMVDDVDDVVESEGTEIKGLESASSRVIRMIPGLREAQRITRSIGTLSEGSVMGVVGLLMVAYSIYRQINAMLEEQKQQQADYQKAIIEIRGFTTVAQFTQYQDNQRRAIENSYRPGIIP